MTPELQAMIEAVGEWQTRGRRDALAQADVATAYDAYMASLNTPPSVLPPAPEGKKWVRVEYPNGWGGMRRMVIAL